MKLRELLHGVDTVQIHADLEQEIAAVAYDSRAVQPGGMFVAVAGFASDGNRFIPMAMEKGAAVIVTASVPSLPVPYVQVASDRLALAQISANWFGHPAEKMIMVGVTGTNGKTSVTLLLKHVLETVLHAKVGLIGTMSNWIGACELPTQRTTPESYELQSLFARMQQARCQYVVMEVSSHALALDRVGGVKYSVGAFTNLTEDHLDFHKTMEAYCDAKAILFSRCAKCVMNQDDPWFGRMKESAVGEVLTTSAEATAGLYAADIALLPDGVRYRAVYGDQSAQVCLPIPGRFSVYNSLTVLGLALELGVDLEAAAAALKTARGVKGRVEVVPTPGKDFTVLIDYAHTPDGLENVLSTVRGFCKGRLIAVFGCGGDRDPMKRPIMARIGARLADFAILTSDNPRSEDPEAILTDMCRGLTGENWEVVPDRRAAIRRAMDMAKQGDIVVLAGKGHETYQEIQGVKRHLDEREEVAAHLKEME